MAGHDSFPLWQLLISFIFIPQVLIKLLLALTHKRLENNYSQIFTECKDILTLYIHNRENFLQCGWLHDHLFSFHTHLYERWSMTSSLTVFVHWPQTSEMWEQIKFLDKESLLGDFSNEKKFEEVNHGEISSSHFHKTKIVSGLLF